jgi:YVTN family beta-propeller protein
MSVKIIIHFKLQFKKIYSLINSIMRNITIDNSFLKTLNFMERQSNFRFLLVLKNDLMLLVAFAFLLVSCDDMVDKLPDGKLPTTSEASQIFVLSEGLFNMNNSTLALYDLKNKTTEKDFFLKVNKRGLGDTANDMALYGSKLYVVVSVSSQIEVLDAMTGKSLKQIPLFDESGVARQPRYIDFYEDKAYICSFDGTVAKIDTVSLQVEKIIKVGKNPDGICVANNKIYVSNSGGLNFPTYDNTVSVIDIQTFEEIKKIEVAMNPSSIESDSEGDVYVVSRGEYGENGYVFQRINSKLDILEESFEEINALNFSIHNDTAYIYNYDFMTSSSWVKVFDCKQEKIVSENFVSDGTEISTPYAISVNPENSDVYITDALSFTVWGNLHCFDKSGKLKFSIREIGLNSNKVLFR